MIPFPDKNATIGGIDAGINTDWHLGLSKLQEFTDISVSDGSKCYTQYYDYSPILGLESSVWK